MGLGRLGVHHARHCPQAYACHHRQRDAVYHLSGMACDDGRAEDGIASISNVEFDEAVYLSIGNRPVDVMHRHGECLNGNATLTRLLDVHADMGDLRTV